jgi:hypothetical protein
MLDCGVALRGYFSQRRNQICCRTGLGGRALMPRKHVSAITVLVTLPASADTIFDNVGASPAARDTVVDGGLIGCDIVTEKCGASAPVTLLICLEPQDRSSGKLVSGWSFHGFAFSQVVLGVCRRCPVWATGGGGLDLQQIFDSFQMEKPPLAGRRLPAQGVKT